MAATTQSQVVSPVLFTEAVQGAFASKNAFAGSLAQQLGIVIINDQFPMAGKEAIGQTIEIPYFSSIGEFQDNVSDGTAATTKQMSQTNEQGTVIRGTLGFEVSRWAKAASNIQGGMDIYTAAGEQAVISGQRYMDRKIIDAAVAGNNQLVKDVYSSSTPVNISYDLLIDSLGLWGDFGGLDQVAALAVHSKVMVDLMKLKDTTGRPLLTMPVDGVDQPPRFMGKPVIVSDRLPLDNSTMSAVTLAGTSPPVITLTNSANRENGTGPVRPMQLKVACTTGGALGTWKFKISLDNGNTYTAADGYTSAATVALTDPLDPAGGLLGVTLNIAAGSATNDNTWSASTILKHTSLLLKRGALAFWYNRAALQLATIPVPLADTVQAALHMYCVAYRYQRLAGQPYPGVVKIRHNAGSL